MQKALIKLIVVLLFYALSFSAYAWKISAGTVTMNDPTVTSGYQTVSFTGSFFDVTPVVFVLPRNSETEPRSLRIRNVTTSGFEIIQVRPTVCGGCADAGNFATPTISWIAIEPGRHRLPSGDYIQVGTLDTTTSQSKLGGTEGWDTVNFSTAFSSGSVAIVGQVQTSNNTVSTTGGTSNPFITTAIRNANASSFEIAMELSEVSAAPPASAETIGWLAAEDGMTDTLTDTGSGSVLIEAILTADNITDDCLVDNTFSNAYGSSPLVVASKNRLDGGDGGWTRQCQISSTDVRFKIQEDEGTDNDVNHTTESVGVFVVEGAFDAEVIDPTANPIANWRMDEFSWSGTSGEVSDETGNFNATALNSAQTSNSAPAIAGTPGTCYYGTFPFNNTAVPPDAVDSGLNIDTDVGNVGTITMWYFSNSNWNGGGDRQLLDAGFNAAAGGPKYFFLTLQNGGNLRFGYEDSVDGDFRLNSPVQAFTAGTWVHIAVTWDLPNDTQAIYINGTQVASQTTSSNGVMGELDTLYIGDNNGNYIIGGDTTANSANGGIDEVRIYDSVLSAVDINSIRNDTHDCQSDLFFEVDSVVLNDTNVTPGFTSVSFRQTYTSAPLVFALPTNTDTDPASLRVRNITTTGFEIAQVEPESLDGRQNAMTVDYIAIMPGVNILPDGRTVEAGTHTTTSVQHGSGVPGGEAWDTVNFTSTFSTPSVLLQIQELANEYNNPPTTTSTPWLTASIQNVGNTSFQTALERSEVNDGAAATIAANETIAYLAIDGNVQGSFTAEGKTILYESINSADAIAGWDNENCAGNVGESISFINTYSATPLAIAHTRRHDGGDGGWIVRCSIDTAQIGLAYDEDIFNDAERSHTNEQASVFVFSEAFCYPTCVSTAVDHYAISYAATPGVTCEATSVTITAHDSSDMPVDVPGGTVLTVTSVEDGTASNEGSWGDKTAGTGSVAGFPGNPVTYTWPVSGESSFTIPLTQTTPLTIDIDLLDTNGDMEKGDGDNSDPEDTPIEFRDAVFRFFAGGAVDTIGTQIAGKESNIAPGIQTLQIRTVETDPSTGVCGSRVSGAQTIDMAYKCNNPTTCEASIPIDTRVEITNTALASFDLSPGNDNADTVDDINGSYDPVDLTFNASGQADFSFDFNDVGQIQLFARLTVPASGVDPEYTLFGSSNMFIVRPFGFDVEVAGNPAAATAAGSAFMKAGDDFTVTTRAVVWDASSDDGVVDGNAVGTANDGIPDGHESGDVDPDNNTDLSALVATPNFGQEGSDELTDEDIDLSSDLFLPNPAGDDPGLSGGTTISSFTSGSGNSTTVQYDEVGIIEIEAEVASDQNYLGAGAVIGKSGHVGRFYPDRFSVSMDNTPGFADSCSGFTYQDQPFYYDTAPVLEITAYSSNGNVTENYGGDFWKLTGSTLARNYVDGSVTPPTASFSFMTSGSVSLAGETDFDGIGTLSLDSGSGADEFMYQKGIPEVEFPADVDVTFQAIGFQDTDHTVGSPVCYDATNDGTCDDFTHLMIQGTNLRWGRMILTNAFGSELLAIEVPLSVEYYNTDGFEINTADTCTTYDSADMSFSNLDGLLIGDLSITGSGTMVSGQDDSANSILATSSNNVGSADITINLTSQDWLQFDWDSDTNYDNNPTGRITWGIFSGPDEFIYIREPW